MSDENDPEATPPETENSPPVGKLAKIRGVFAIVLNPIVLLSIGAVFFSLGFMGGMWEVGFWKPVHRVPVQPVGERARLELERLQKIGIDMDAHSNELKKRKDDLDEREIRLLKAETDLQQERISLKEVNDHIDSMRKQFDDRIVSIETSIETNIAQLSKLYAAMSPQSAAKILATLPDPQTVQIIRKMKESQSAKILDVWAADPLMAPKATRITALMRVAVVSSPAEGGPVKIPGGSWLSAIRIQLLRIVA